MTTSVIDNYSQNLVHEKKSIFIIIFTSTARVKEEVKESGIS